MPAQQSEAVTATAKLHRVLGTWDLALMAVAAIVSLRLISVTSAESGPASLGLWVLGLVAFFIPAALAITELSSRIPGEGGFYLWARAAFGDLNGFIAGWAYVTSNLAYFPSLLLSGAASLLYIGGAEWAGLDADPVYSLGFTLTGLWLATWLNIIGLERAKWLTDFAGIATWLVAVMLLAAGIVAWNIAGAATVITPQNVIPDLSAWTNWVAFSGVALAYVGLELGPLMGGEIKDPRRTIARAVLLAGVIIAVIYVVGTAAMLVAVPASKIDTINGIPQALTAMGEALNIPGLGSLTAALISLSAIGGLSAWLAGTARLPFVFGIDRYLPAALGRVHPRYGTPHVALLTQSILATVVLVLAVSGETVKEAFSLLLNMTIILSLAPLLYIFASLPVLRWKARGNNEGVYLVPGGLFGCIVVGALGFATTLLAIVVAMIPPADADPFWYIVKAIGGCIVFQAVGLAFFLNGRRKLNAAAGS